jgi:hypothetical protein
MLAAMNKMSKIDKVVDHVLRDQCDLITRSQALAEGLSESALRARLQPGGRWTIVLPGVYFAHNGSLTVGQREMAAVLYGGRDSVITGQSALARRGVRISPTQTIDVLVPHDRRRQSAGFVVIHRTKRLPEQAWQSNGLRWAPAARAVADAVRGETDLRQVRAVVAAAVQQRKCTIEQVKAEMLAGPARGSAALRAALLEVAAGADSGVEVEFHQLVQASGLPQPLYNADLYAGQEFLARPDAWWPRAGVAAEVDSREWHLSPIDWERTLARHAKMSAHGIVVLHLTPQRIRSTPAVVVSELTAAVQYGEQRAPLAIRAVTNPR